MRIAFYAPLKPPDHPIASGDRTVARMLLSALKLGGHQVGLASRFRSFDGGDGERQNRLRQSGMRLAERYIRRAEKADAIPDLWFTYHLYHKAPDWIGPRVSEAFDIPYVVAEASFAPKQAGGAWDLGHRAVAEALKGAALILQLNPADAECVLPLVSDPGRLQALSPFLETGPFRAVDRGESRKAVARLFSLDLEQPWLVTVAMMRDDQKLLSYRCLAKAMARLADRRWQLVIAGIGEAEAHVRQAFAPMADRVRWAGILSPDLLRLLYRSADLYVWPAVKEAFGMALLEAQAAGLPVVAGRSGGVAGVVGDRVTGLLVREGDTDDLADAVASLLEDPVRRREMSVAAQEKAEREHDVAVAARTLDEHLRRLARER
jgi:glycosyltransferase involved in cell wall biosynthesis